MTDRTKCPLCGEVLRRPRRNADVDVNTHLPLDDHFEDAHNLQRYGIDSRYLIVCFCGEAFETHDNREAHLWSVTDWPAHITLGILKQL